MKLPFKINTKKKDCSKLLLSTFSFIANSSSKKLQEVTMNIDGELKKFTVRVVK